jgi:tripartite-type tricarboxylate transporter receptor subunit TctC
MRRFLIPFAAVALLAIGQGAQAQAFPNKPIRLVAPFSPGGALDLIARGIGQKLSEGMRQPVIVCSERPRLMASIRH